MSTLLVQLYTRARTGPVLICFSAPQHFSAAPTYTRARTDCVSATISLGSRCQACPGRSAHAMPWNLEVRPRQGFRVGFSVLTHEQPVRGLHRSRREA